jgi:hypothetical protein
MENQAAQPKTQSGLKLVVLLVILTCLLAYIAGYIDTVSRYMPINLVPAQIWWSGLFLQSVTCLYALKKPGKLTRLALYYMVFFWVFFVVCTFISVVFHPIEDISGPSAHSY